MTKTTLPAQLDSASPLPEEIESAVERALKGKVAKRDIPQITRQITQLVVSEQFSGPLPHPKHLREYEAALPGAAERILTMAERNLDSVIKSNANILAAEIEDRKRGMYLGAALFALLIVCGFASIFLTDSEIVPGLFLGAAAIGGVATFIKGRNGG